MSNLRFVFFFLDLNEVEKENGFTWFAIDLRTMSSEVVHTRSLLPVTWCCRYKSYMATGLPQLSHPSDKICCERSADIICGCFHRIYPPHRSTAGHPQPPVLGSGPGRVGDRWIICLHSICLHVLLINKMVRCGGQRLLGISIPSQVIRSLPECFFFFFCSTIYWRQQSACVWDWMTTRTVEVSVIKWVRGR